VRSICATPSVVDVSWVGAKRCIQTRGLDYWADPSRKQRGEINHWDDGRGVYFDDPNRHLIEAITRPYGASGCEADQPHPLLDCGK
jgi:hypothetical protein